MPDEARGMRLTFYEHFSCGRFRNRRGLVELEDILRFSSSGLEPGYMKRNMSVTYTEVR